MGFRKALIIFVGILLWLILLILPFLPVGGFSILFPLLLLPPLIIGGPILIVYDLLKNVKKNRMIKIVLLSIIAVPLAIVTSFATGLFLGSIIAPVIRNLDTSYTPGFTQEKFNTIKLGSTKEDVLQILGEPFYKEDWKGDRAVEFWQYTKSGKTGDIDVNDFVGGIFIKIWFDKGGKVVNKTSDVF